MKGVSFLTLVLGMLISMPLFGQREVRILTNMHCVNCKKKIENELSFTKGVKDVSADLQSKVVTVQYDPETLSEKKILENVRKLGYQASIVSSEGEPPQSIEQNTSKDCCKSKENKKCCRTKKSEHSGCEKKD